MRLHWPTLFTCVFRWIRHESAFQISPCERAYLKAACVSINLFLNISRNLIYLLFVSVRSWLACFHHQQGQLKSMEWTSKLQLTKSDSQLVYVHSTMFFLTSKLGRFNKTKIYKHTTFLRHGKKLQQLCPNMGCFYAMKSGLGICIWPSVGLWVSVW